MARTATDTMPPDVEEALAAFHPERFEFRPHGQGWVKDLAGLGPVVVAPLSWQHAHAPSFDRAGGERVPTDALSLLVALQRRTWGLPPEDLVPANLLAVLADTSGSVLVAYARDAGFNADGWLGFAIAAGARSGTLVSHMLGVREEARGAGDLGWYLKLIQGYEALRSGHTAATWTFDPLRGANARLNIEKLGASVDKLTIDKYGALRSALYGEDVPSDRLTARWHLVAPATLKRIADVGDGRYRGPAPDDLSHVPEVTPTSLPDLARERPGRLRYRIPGDIDDLARRDPPAAFRWRREMREVLGALLTTASAAIPRDTVADPALLEAQERPGEYVINGFATVLDGAGERVSFYVLERPLPPPREGSP